MFLYNEVVMRILMSNLLLYSGNVSAIAGIYEDEG